MNVLLDVRMLVCVFVSESMRVDMLLVVTIFPFHQFCIEICYYLFGYLFGSSVCFKRAFYSY